MTRAHLEMARVGMALHLDRCRAARSRVQDLGRSLLTM